MKPTPQALEAAQLIRDRASLHGCTFREAANSWIAERPHLKATIAMGIAAASAQAPRTKGKILGDVAPIAAFDAFLGELVGA